MQPLLLILIASVFLVPLVASLGYLAYWLFSLPMRRHERARLILDLIESGLKRGQAPEQTILALARTGDPSLGKGFRRVAKLVEQGSPAHQALEQAPGFLPSPVAGMLQAGHALGDLGKVLPACREKLKDGVTQTWTGHHYLMLLAFVLTPAWLIVSSLFMVFVLPKLRLIAEDLGAGATPMFDFLGGYYFSMVVVQVVMLLAFYVAALGYMAGPTLTRLLGGLFPGLPDWLGMRIPWRRHRAQRDFSALLAALLDAGTPEPRAVELAAVGTANRLFMARAARAIADLARGVNLAEAIKHLDDAGELRWRLGNAARAGGGFLTALAGWHDALESKAYRQEQTAAQVLTTGVVLANGCFVGMLTFGVFHFLTSTLSSATLW